MSHVTTLELPISNLDTLLDTATDLGGQVRLTDGAEFRSYAGQRNQCAAVITIPGSTYDVGVVAQSDGTFRLAYDNWSYDRTNLIEQTFGPQLKTLRQHYLANTAAKELKKKGFRELSRSIDEAGLLRLKLGRG